MARGHRGPHEAETRNIPWGSLSSNLKGWLRAFTAALSNGQPRKVHSLMEALVTFMASNQGHFLQMLMGSSSIADGLRQQGATEEFIQVFMDVMSVVGSNTAPRIITFGSSSGLRPVELAALLQRFTDALHSPAASPNAAASPNHPRSPRLLPPSPTRAAQAQHSADGPEVLSLAIERIQSIEVSRVSNALLVPPSALPPEVISGLAKQQAVPFLFFRWLARCLVEVLFCVQFQDTTYVVDSRVVYVGPKPETQLEGHLCLPSVKEKGLLMGPDALPWTSIGGLLEAPEEEPGN